MMCWISATECCGQRHQDLCPNPSDSWKTLTGAGRARTPRNPHVATHRIRVAGAIGYSTMQIRISWRRRPEGLCSPLVPRQGY